MKTLSLRVGGVDTQKKKYKRQQDTKKKSEKKKKNQFFFCFGIFLMKPSKKNFFFFVFCHSSHSIVGRERPSQLEDSPAEDERQHERRASDRRQRHDVVRTQKKAEKQPGAPERARQEQAPADDLPCLRNARGHRGLAGGSNIRCHRDAQD